MSYKSRSRSQLRVVEIPSYGTFFGRAHPHTIAVTEDNLLSRVDESAIDQPFYGTAHEVAHQLREQIGEERVNTALRR